MKVSWGCSARFEGIWWEPMCFTWDSFEVPTIYKAYGSGLCKKIHRTPPKYDLIWYSIPLRWTWLRLFLSQRHGLDRVVSAVDGQKVWQNSSATAGRWLGWQVKEAVSRVMEVPSLFCLQLLVAPARLEEFIPIQEYVSGDSLETSYVRQPMRRPTEREYDSIIPLQRPLDTIILSPSPKDSACPGVFLCGVQWRATHIFHEFP